MSRTVQRSVVLALAALITIAWMWNPGGRLRFDWRDDHYAPLGFRAELTGDAPKGVCYRILVPYFCRAVQAATPGAAKEALSRMAQKRPISLMAVESDLMPAYGAAGLVIFACMACVGFTVGPLGQLLCWAAIGPAMGLCDPVTMAMFSLGIWALWRGRERWFWVAFVLATMNRESSFLLLIYYALATKNRRGALAGAGFYTAFRLIVAEVYRDNTISMVWYELERNLKLIGPVRLSNLIPYLAVLWLAWIGRGGLPAWMRRGFWISALLWIPAGVYASRAEALRTYLELMPPLALSMSAGLRSLRGSSR